LFAAASLWFGWSDFLAYLYLTALAGGVLVLVLVGLRRAVPALAGEAAWIKNSALELGGPVPYGIALAAGAFWLVPRTGLLLAG